MSDRQVRRESPPIDSYLSEVERISKEISREEIDAAIHLLYRAWERGSNVFLVGNGGSASTASHLASDLAKYVSVKGKKRFRPFALTDNMPLMTALVNDEGWSSVYEWQLENLMREGDLLIAISVHGGSGSDAAGPWSQNLLKGARFVKERHGFILGLAGFDGGLLKQMADVCIVVPAESTPQVEGFHLVVTHLIVDRLRQLIADS